MFADEPTGNLDSPTSCGDPRAAARGRHELGQTTVMVTHDAHAAAIADRMLFLADGQIVADLGPSTPTEILDDARGGDRDDDQGRPQRTARPQAPRTLTAFAIVLGVAMISGSFVLTDTLGASFDGIYQETYKGPMRSSARSAGAAGRRHPEGTLLGRRAHRGRAGVRRPGRAGSIEDRGRPRRQSAGSGSASRVRDRLRHRQSRRPRLSPGRARGGHVAGHGDEIAIDRATAKKQHFAVGQTVGAFGDGPVEGTGSAGSSGSAAPTRSAARRLPCSTSRPPERLFNKQGKFDLIRLGAGNGVTPEELVERLTPKVSARARVKTAEGAGGLGQQADAGRSRAASSILLGFGGIALFVGGFVIANTLAITVAQRMRELATLRTLGASRRRCSARTSLEAIAIGLVGSVDRAVPRPRRSRAG